MQRVFIASGSRATGIEAANKIRCLEVNAEDSVRIRNRDAKSLPIQFERPVGTRSVKGKEKETPNRFVVSSQITRGAKLPSARNLSRFNRIAQSRREPDRVTLKIKLRSRLCRVTPGMTALSGWPGSVRPETGTSG